MLASNTQLSLKCFWKAWRTSDSNTGYTKQKHTRHRDHWLHFIQLGVFDLLTMHCWFGVFFFALKHKVKFYSWSYWEENWEPPLLVFHMPYLQKLNSQNYPNSSLLAFILPWRICHANQVVWLQQQLWLTAPLYILSFLEILPINCTLQGAEYRMVLHNNVGDGERSDMDFFPKIESKMKSNSKGIHQRGPKGLKLSIGDNCWTVT